MQFLLLLAIVSSFTACKLVDDNDQVIFDTNKKGTATTADNSVKVTDPPIARPGDLEPLLPSPVFREPTPSELSFIKLNGESIAISVNQMNNHYRSVKNSRVVTMEKPTIESIEIGFKPDSQTPAYKNYINIRLRSLSSSQILSINYDTYLLGEFNGVGEFEENISLNFEDHDAGFFASIYNRSLDNLVDIVSIKPERIFVDVTALLVRLKDVGIDERMHYSKGEVDLTNYDITTQLFSDDLFSFEISMGGELLYEGLTFGGLNNCVFASSDTPPADVDDICKAYLSMR